jgi:hypothetical protein
MVLAFLDKLIAKPIRARIFIIWEMSDYVINFCICKSVFQSC